MCKCVSIFTIISQRISHSTCRVTQSKRWCRVRSLEWHLDDRYANKFTPLGSTAIYPKPGHQLLYTSMTGEMKCPRLYLCLAHYIQSPQMSMQHMHQHDQQWYDPLHIITWSYWFIDLDFTCFSPLPSSIGAKSCSSFTATWSIAPKPLTCPSRLQPVH